jgi:hypothetical protein
MVLWCSETECWVKKQFESVADDKWSLITLVNTMVDKHIIPEHIKNDQLLYQLLLLQVSKIVIEMIIIPTYGFILPEFNYRPMSTHYMLCGILQRIEIVRTTLERQTGVNIDHYYRLRKVWRKRSATTLSVSTKRYLFIYEIIQGGLFFGFLLIGRLFFVIQHCMAYVVQPI